MKSTAGHLFVPRRSIVSFQGKFECQAQLGSRQPSGLTFFVPVCGNGYDVRNSRLFAAGCLQLQLQRFGDYKFRLHRDGTVEGNGMNFTLRKVLAISLGLTISTLPVCPMSWAQESPGPQSAENAADLNGKIEKLTHS